MKSFKEYLTESKKVYEFKIKIAGEVSGDSTKQLKQALDQYKVEGCSAGRRTPIQESPVDFPDHKNVNVTIFDVTLAYPANSAQIRAAVSEGLKLALSCVSVTNLKEEEEIELNHEYDEKSDESVLLQGYEIESEGQKLVGEQQKMSLLKELNKTKHAGEQYKGVNDELLATGAPKHVKDTPGKQVKVKTKVTNLFTKQVKVPTAKGVK